MQTGKHRYMVNLYRRVDSQAPSGQVIADRVFVRKAWASMRALTGRELIAAQQVQSEATTRFDMRYRDDVDETFSIGFIKRYASPMIEEVYDIVAPPLVDERTARTSMTLMCVLRRAEGWRT